jgi:NADPH-dependent 2,4-dienoyl-CoA reductase/sulfur reductase-like enzyme
MITHIGPDFGGDVIEVDPAAMTLTIDGMVNNVDVCNVIPAMKAGRIAEIAGITENNWAPVNAIDLSSKMDPNIHVLGDAAAQGDMPKSGYSANSQAKVCANAVRGALTGSTVFPARFANTCWSLIDTDDGVKVGATYEATDEKIASVESFISQNDESAEVRAATYRESLGWYDGITADMFG